jgi:hypothetical protein
VVELWHGSSLVFFSLPNQEALKNKGDEAWEMARRVYLANDNIRNMFLECAISTDSIMSDKEK